MSFELANKVADAVLYEGYILYPYRASAAKNQLRWQFGVVAPRGYAESGGTDDWLMQTECLIEPQGDAELDVRIRFLQLQRKVVEHCTDAVHGLFERVESLDVSGRRFVSWEEGAAQELDLTGVRLAGLPGAERVFSFETPGGRDVEWIRDGLGKVEGRIIRERWPISFAVRICVEKQKENLIKLCVRIENASDWTLQAGAGRSQALQRSLISAHTLLAVRQGNFLSLLDPPSWAAPETSACRNIHTWPVLIGEDRQRNMMLSSPIILYDYPAVAPESPGDLFDATEIEELLTLRVMTLTEEEKLEARGTDDRARRIVERSESIPGDRFARLHGAMRSLRPVERPVSTEPPGWEALLHPPAEESPEEARLQIGGVPVSKGSRVQLRPRRRADAMDMFLEGRAARVEGIYRDIEGAAQVAVVLEDDPAAGLHSWYGRFFYFYPEEIEPLDPIPAASPEA
jgi:hypothetical protein